MGGDFFLILDIITIGLGLGMILFPAKAYGWVRTDAKKGEMPKRWNIISRVIGVVVVALGALFIYLDLSSR